MTRKVVDISDVKWGKTRTGGAADWQRRQKRRMRTHSRLVVSLKILFPSMAAVLIGLVIVCVRGRKYGFARRSGNGQSALFRC